MSILTRFSLCVFFSLGFLISLVAQEATSHPETTQATREGGNEAPLPTAPAESPVESANPTSTTEASSFTKGNASAETTPSACETPASGNIPAASQEASSGASSLVEPTDPSMTPPPQEASPNAESGTATPGVNEAEQQTLPPELPSTQSIEKKKQELKVRYYQVRTQVEKEAEVSSLKERANHATTDEGKRQALRAYYELLFTKMKKVDASISERCDLLEKAYLHRLEQVTIQPTIPLAPPPTAVQEKK